MPTTYEEILQSARGLKQEDQARLVSALWTDLPDDLKPPLDSEWMAEIQRRSNEIDSGSVTTIPWSVVRERARARGAQNG